jgi:hypothetical protein
LFIVVDVHVVACPEWSVGQETVMVRSQVAAWTARGEARRTRERNHRGRDRARDKGISLLMKLDGILSKVIRYQLLVIRDPLSVIRSSVE